MNKTGFVYCVKDLYNPYCTIKFKKNKSYPYEIINEKFLVRNPEEQLSIQTNIEDFYKTYGMFFLDPIQRRKIVLSTI